MCNAPKIKGGLGVNELKGMERTSGAVPHGKVLGAVPHCPLPSFVALLHEGVK